MKQDNTLVFFGDSLTEWGDWPGGYVTLLRTKLNSANAKFRIINAGVAGNTVADLLERLDRDVLAHQPARVVLYIGVNDVWRFDHMAGTPRPEFESQYRELVSKLEAPDRTLLLCTLSVIGEKAHGDNRLDSILDDYSEIIRTVAREREITLCDLRASFLSYLERHNTKNVGYGVLTSDEVHLSELGNRLVAENLYSLLR